MHLTHSALVSARLRRSAGFFCNSRFDFASTVGSARSGIVASAQI